MVKKKIIRYPQMRTLKKLLKEEHQKLGTKEHPFAEYEIGSRGYDNVCKRIALLEEIISRKKKLKKIV